MRSGFSALADAESTFRVEVVYAEPGHQTRVAVHVEPGTSAADVIEQSGVLKLHPEIDLAKNRIGIFSRLIKPGYAVAAGDRVEIYRPLKIDPREARRQLALTKAGKKAGGKE